MARVAVSVWWPGVLSDVKQQDGTEPYIDYRARLLILVLSSSIIYGQINCDQERTSNP